MVKKRLGPYARAEKSLIRMVGTRGICLLLLGIMWTVLGIAFITNPVERFSKPGPGGVLDFLDQGPGVYIFASMWIVGGAVAFATALQRPITCRDDLGFNGIGLPPFIWGAGYWWSYFIFAASDGEYGRPNTYLAGILYWTFALLIMFLSRNLSDHPDGPCAQRRAQDGRLSK